MLFHQYELAHVLLSDHDGYIGTAIMWKDD